MDPKSLGRPVDVRRGDITIEAFEYGDGEETLILAAGNARPAAQLERLGSDLAEAGIHTITFNYRGVGGSR